MSFNKSIRLSLSVKFSLIIMMTSFLGMGALTYVAYEQSKRLFAEKNALTLNNDLDRFKSKIEQNIAFLKQNAITLAENESVKGYLRAYHNPHNYDAEKNKTIANYDIEVKRLFKLMLNQNPAYFQVRLIDANTGNELIRLDRIENSIIICPEDQLQNKKQASYIQGLLKNPQQIYISDVNLNREHGKIEYPIRPTIRVSKITEGNQKFKGIIVINVNFAKLLNFHQLRQDKLKHTFIINKQGYYILNTQSPFKEFGFELNTEYRAQEELPFITPLLTDHQKQTQLTQGNRLISAQKVFLDHNNFLIVTKTMNQSLSSQDEKAFFLTLSSYILVILLFIVLITLMVVKQFIKPIQTLTKIADQIAKTRGEEPVHIKIHTGDEVEALAKAFNLMLDNLIQSKKEIADFADKLEIEVAEKTKELQQLNQGLQKTVDDKLAEIRKKDQALLQQNKLATIGETIGAIAHQWRQPLNALALNIQMLIDMAEDGNCTAEEMEEFVERNMKTIHFMSQTIDDFRNFFRESREKERFNLKDAICSTLSLQEQQLKNHNIEIITELEDIELEGYKSKFMQVILNLISNAKDAILDKQAKDGMFKGQIHITLHQKDACIILEISDNGKDVPEKQKPKIFEPYFTTKEEGKGTGMGLYMSKEIIKSMNGEIQLTYPNNQKTFEIKICPTENH